MGGTDHEPTIMNPRAPEPAPQGTLEGTSHRTSWNSPNQHHDPTTPKHTHPNANKSPKPLKCPKRNNSRFFKSGNCENSFLPVCIVFGALFFNDCFKIYVITRTHCSFSHFVAFVQTSVLKEGRIWRIARMQPMLITKFQNKAVVFYLFIIYLFNSLF